MKKRIRPCDVHSDLQVFADGAPKTLEVTQMLATLRHFEGYLQGVIALRARLRRWTPPPPNRGAAIERGGRALAARHNQPEGEQK